MSLLNTRLNVLHGVLVFCTILPRAPRAIPMLQPCSTPVRVGDESAYSREADLTYRLPKEAYKL